MKYSSYILTGMMVVLCGCSVKRNNFFSRNYHQLTTRYNVYFNGDQALKSGIKHMENRHKEDYTHLLPVFVSNDEQTRSICSSDMDYVIEKAAKAIDKHSITANPGGERIKIPKIIRPSERKKNLITSWINAICYWGKLISIRRNTRWPITLFVLYKGNMPKTRP